MRIFDIIKESTEVENINADLQDLAQSAESDPKIASLVKKGLDEIINGIKNFLKKHSEENSTEIPIQEDTSEDIKSSISTLMIYLDEIGKLPNADVLMPPIQDTIKKLQDQVEKLEADSIRKGFKTGTELANKPLGKQIEAFQARTTEQLSALPQLEGQEEIVEILSDKFTTLLGQGVEEEHISSFINMCSSANRLVDMPSLIEGDSQGSLVSGLDSKYIKILKAIAPVIPFSGASTGQGEWLLVLIGKNTFKANPGDIYVVTDSGEKQVELKASAQGKGKSSITDFTLGAILDVKTASQKMASIIETVTGKKVKRIPAINPKNLETLNPLFVEMNQKQPGAVQKMFAEVLGIVYPSDEMTPAIEEFTKTIPENGLVDYEELAPAAGMLASEYYKIVNNHDVLMTMNIPNLTYACTSDRSHMNKLIKEKILKVTSLIDFRDRPGNISFKHQNPPKTKLKEVDDMILNYFEDLIK